MRLIQKYEHLSIRMLLLTCLTVTLIGTDSIAAEDKSLKYEVRKIWDQANHNAFTGLVRFDDQFFCTFREGTGHVPGENGRDGEIRVLTSADGQQWKSFALISENEVDLRDPKLSVTPDGHLMLLIGGSYYEGTKILKREPRVCFLESGSQTFSTLTPIRMDPAIRTNFDWLWRVTWHENTGYGIMYQSNQAGVKYGLHLVKTSDGISYENVKSFEIEDSPNEATLRFLDDGTMVMLLRREKGKALGIIGNAKAPYTEWTLKELDHRLGGPDFIVLENGKLIAGTRKYQGPAKTILAEVDLQGHFKELIEFPSGGDTSYPGFVTYDGQLWMTYYSSHEGKTSIYLATIPLNELN
ncbi:exo-alpha-sialidase [Rubinisphaera italica]|uniref:Exo-alpha-sialidase n=1 Tax=Rubinisphaera italica TaxID=2527969 RepID=A0A5C5XPV4_9PLAN|nr:exo-alpha-sialidase [Rubinisphaera italica]TWT64433.1 hypothetical protein Pan54_51960 [Rubinisphaera italica]